MRKENEQISAPLWFSRDCRLLRESRNKSNPVNEGKLRSISQEACSNASVCLFSDKRKEKPEKPNAIKNHFQIPRDTILTTSGSKESDRA